MTIEKGKDWGVPSTAPTRCIPCSNADQLLAAHLIPDALAYVTQGDLWTLLGHPSAPVVGGPVLRLSLDALAVTLDDREYTAVENVEIRRRTRSGGRLRGRLVLVSNIGVWNGRNVAPRAHPNDSRMDVVEVSASMSIRERVLAWRRARLAHHLPHPLISAKSTTELVLGVMPDEVVIVDGRRQRGTRLSVRIVADHLSVGVPAPTVAP